MRVNLVGSHRPGTGVGQDLQILHGLIAHVLGADTQIRHIPHYYPQCPEADVTVFIEVITPSLIAYGGRTIWIPNPEWTYATWAPYASHVDEVWVKTRDAEAIFAAAGIPTRYIGWTSIDKTLAPAPSYSKAIVPTGKNIWRNPKPILQAYLRLARTDPILFRDLPELHVVHWSDIVPVSPLPPDLEGKVVLHSQKLSTAEYDALLAECGLCICMSAAEGFGHAVNEAMSSGAVLMLSPINAFRELSQDAIWVSTSKIIPHPQCFGVLEDVDIDSLTEALRLYAVSRLDWKQRLSARSRDTYETRHREFVTRMEGVLAEWKDLPTYSLDALLPTEESLPKVSIITVTKNRRAFIPLAKYCVLAQAYPEDKLEWVIVDDGTDQIKDLVSDMPNVTYVLCDEREGGWTIGAKRNLGISRAAHDVLVMMDDDDVYPNNSVLTRVAFLLANPKPHGCVFSTTIPCYDIHQTKSFMNVPPMTLPQGERVSEATLACTREFWTERPFPDVQIAEAGAFIRGREDMCREVSPQDVIVSLTHKATTSSRKAPPGEANGCHYGFADELFTLVSEIAQSIA
jgi:hypothetical protein